MRLNRFLFCAAVCVCMFLLLSCCTQDEDIIENGPVPDEAGIVTGDFRPISSDTPVVQQCFRFLVDKLSITHPDIVLGNIKESYSQVVAGQKIKLVCFYTNKKTKENAMLCTAQVYINSTDNIQLLEISF